MRYFKKRLPRYIFTMAFSACFLFSVFPAQAQFFTQAENYANQVFPTATPITLLIFGGIRLIFAYFIGSKVLQIISGGRGTDKVADLSQDVVILLVIILVVDALSLLVFPAI